VRSASLLVLAAAASSYACTYDIPDLAAADGGSRDAATVEASAGGDAGADAGPSDGTTPQGDAPVVPPVYSDLSDTSKWQVFDTAPVTGGTGESFGGGSFDGRYVYLAPSTGATSYSVVTRFDTSTGAQGFADPGSWSTFDTLGVSQSAQGFTGAIYDGTEFFYLTPFVLASGSPDGVVARYDTRAPFGTSTSWSAFDTSAANPNSQGFSGEAFDGRYLYLVPSVKGDNSEPNGFVARYDTQAQFGNTNSWTFFDLAVLGTSSSLAGFLGAVFDGRYVDFIPSYASVAVRYDTQAEFADTASWATFDTQPVANQPPGFGGGAFDGRYVYYVPGFYAASMGDTFLSVAVRFDTKGSFTDQASWSGFDVSTVGMNARGFAGGGFDGRYVYFVPYAVNATSPTTFVYDGLVVRYDTTADFAQATSWSSFDTTGLSQSAHGFFGAVFDGEYLYLVPSGSTVVARFDAKTPRSLPALPQFQGSFL
jgi:hypothetical protein